VHTLGNYIGGNQRFADRLDEMRVYAEALSASEIAELANPGPQAPVVTTGPSAFGVVNQNTGAPGTTTVSNTVVGGKTIATPEFDHPSPMLTGMRKQLDDANYRINVVSGVAGDVLNVGHTIADDDDEALMSVWTSTDLCADRVAAIDALMTVIDDEEEDVLTGSSGRDLFYDGLLDVLND
jgi:hypothetical protein